MTTKKPVQTLPFLVVARTGAGPHPHPVEIAVHPDGADSRISFSLGAHAANVGGQLPLSEVVDKETGLNPRFQEAFDAGDVHWVVPYLERLLAGEDVADEMRAAYADRHGRAPTVMRQPWFDG